MTTQCSASNFFFHRDFPDESDYTISGSAQTYRSEEGTESDERVLHSPSPGPDSPTQIQLQGLGKANQEENGRQVVMLWVIGQRSEVVSEIRGRKSEQRRKVRFKCQLAISVATMCDESVLFLLLHFMFFCTADFYYGRFS